MINIFHVMQNNAFTAKYAWLYHISRLKKVIIVHHPIASYSIKYSF